MSTVTLRTRMLAAGFAALLFAFALPALAFADEQDVYANQVSQEQAAAPSASDEKIDSGTDEAAFASAKKQATASAETSSDEVLSDGWHQEGSEYVYWENGEQVKGQWVVTASSPINTASTKSRRYWIDADGYLAVSRFVNPVNTRDAAAGYCARATKNGWVATSKITYKDMVLLPNSKGKLTSTTGWLTTSDYDSSSKRYYLVSVSGQSGITAAKTGFFKVKGSSYYAYPSQGYVMTGKYKYNGVLLLANSKGKLASTSGWLSTNAYDSSKKRYRMVKVPGNSGYYGAKLGYFKVSGKKYYAYLKKGYLAQNKWVSADGKYRWAGKKGALSKARPKAFVKMQMKACKYSSSTKYLILVNTSTFRVGIFEKVGGTWAPRSYWLCAVGTVANPTPHGVYKVASRGYSFGSGFTCYYWTQWNGDYLFHSKTYYPNSMRIMEDDIGKRASHGCIRLTLKHAKWIYMNIPTGTTVVTYG